MQVVWFKRDLRVLDHRPLVTAAEHGPVCCLYVYEPTLLSAPTWDRCHSVFIDQCLAELDEALRAIGGQLCYRYGDIITVLRELHAHTPIHGLWSHEETGDARTFARDRTVAGWCAEQRIEWQEIPQNGVIRRLKTRDGWHKRWDARMHEPLTPAPQLRSANIPAGQRLPVTDLTLPTSTVTEAQPGGTQNGQTLLNEFLYQRGETYQKGMSSPLSAPDVCSRLSPHLAWGSLSMRDIFQQTVEAQRHWKASEAENAKHWRASLRSFQKRLHWHCHFMQKLEDEPAMEQHCIHRGYEGLRENDFNQAWFEQWCIGQTGYPMVDACMRSLAQTGWLNFRMRAMVVSFASYHLWLDWRKTGIWLTQHFVDYEPGIHYSQLQMQSGVTGINTLRMYSPTKQAQDHDPAGAFIRRWIPELAAVPAEYIAEPWTMPELIQQSWGCRIGQDYPAPLVDHKTAVATARSRITARRQDPAVQAEAQSVLQRHGSRKRPATKTRRKTTKTEK